MRTKLLLPNNIFTRIFLSELSLNDNYEISFLPASLIAKEITENDNSIGLIPSLDLLTFKDLFVSSEMGISLNALLSNSYIHFKEGRGLSLIHI